MAENKAHAFIERLREREKKDVAAFKEPAGSDVPVPVHNVTHPDGSTSRIVSIEDLVAGYRRLLERPNPSDRLDALKGFAGEITNILAKVTHGSAANRDVLEMSQALVALLSDMRDQISTNPLIKYAAHPGKRGKRRNPSLREQAHYRIGLTVEWRKRLIERSPADNPLSQTPEAWVCSRIREKLAGSHLTLDKVFGTINYPDRFEHWRKNAVREPLEADRIALICAAQAPIDQLQRCVAASLSEAVRLLRHTYYPDGT